MKMFRAALSSAVLLFTAFTHAQVMIYTTDFTSMAFEKTADAATLTATLSGGSSDLGAASPAHCIVKFKLHPQGDGLSGTLQAFSSDIMEYTDSSTDPGEFTFNAREASVLAPSLSVCPLASDFSGSYRAVERGSKAYASAFRELMQLNHINALDVFQKGNPAQAARLLEPWILSAPFPQEYSASIYNDYGYFLQQAGEHIPAIKVFTLVKTRSPKRVAVYLNLADSLWAIQDVAKAKEVYRVYIDMMAKAGQVERIPARVAERSR